MEEKEVNVVAETENKVKKFLEDRKMFYVDNNGNIVFPEYRYKDLTHAEWFKAIGKDINSTVCGYYLDYKVKIYMGGDYSVPNINFNTFLQIKMFDQYADIQLGLYKGEEGEIWKGKVAISYYELNDSKDEQES